jgi:probable phosphoglycerate mutase
MKLLLVRHGNTFTAGQTPVRVGANEDLPLTPEGEDQARALAGQLAISGIRPDLVVAGPLQRTRRHAEIIMDALGLPGAPEIDARLREIDYGAWGGLSDAEIVARFGETAAEELKAWEDHSRMPETTVAWTPSADEISANIAALASELAGRLGPEQNAMVCSSNGILRFFLELTGEGLSGHQAQGRAKMSTGSASLLRLNNGKAEILFWNAKAGTPLPVSG